MKSAVILAAGEGTRAWPFCGIRQKVTCPVVNVPMVRRLALDLIALGVDEIVAVVGHRAEAVRACLGDLEQVAFVTQPVLKGPAEAALAGVNAITGEEVLVCAGDIVTTRDSLRGLFEAFGARRAEAMLLTADCPAGLTSSWVSVDAAPDGLVRGLWARGDDDRPRYGGIAAARTQRLKRYLERNPGIMMAVGVGAMPPLEGDVAYTFEMMRQDGVEVHSVPAQGFLVDVDKPWHILEANDKAARHAIAVLDKTILGEGASIDDGADIPAGAKLVLAPGARIGKGCHVGGSVILGRDARITDGAIVGGGTVLGDHVKCEKYCNVSGGSVLGAQSLVSHCAEFSGVTFERVYLYHYCCMSGLFGAHVDIGAATVCGTWRFDDRVKLQDIRGRKEPPECFGSATFIGDYSRTGVNTMFMPGVKVGYYSCVGGGAIVYDDVPERTMVLAKQELAAKPWGPEKLGW